MRFFRSARFFALSSSVAVLFLSKFSPFILDWHTLYTVCLPSSLKTSTSSMSRRTWILFTGPDTKCGPVMCLLEHEIPFLSISSIFIIPEIAVYTSSSVQGIVFPGSVSRQKSSSFPSCLSMPPVTWLRASSIIFSRSSVVSCDCTAALKGDGVMVMFSDSGGVIERAVCGAWCCPWLWAGCPAVVTFAKYPTFPCSWSR